MDADFLLPALQTNFHAMKAISTFLKTAKDRNDIVLAFRDMDMIAQDTESLLRDAFKTIIPPNALGTSRWGSESDFPANANEVLQALQTSLALMELEVENLLKRRLETLDETEYQKVKRRTDNVIRLIGSIARYYKGAIVYNYPGFWTVILEKQFEKYLKIKDKDPGSS
jgi:hypothetical protein